MKAKQAALDLAVEQLPQACRRGPSKLNHDHVEPPTRFGSFQAKSGVMGGRTIVYIPSRCNSKKRRSFGCSIAEITNPFM